MVNSVNNNSSNSQTPNNSSTNTYTIRSGDTLSGIAQRTGNTVNSLLSANPQIKNPNLIYAGQQLNIPNGRGTGNLNGITVSKTNSPNESPVGQNTYTVRSGDTLSGIAQRSNTNLNNLLSANPQIKNPNLIYAGQRINMPNGREAANPVNDAAIEQDGIRPRGASPVSSASVPGNVKGGVSVEQLRAIMPSLSQAKAQTYLPYLNSAMAEFKINTPERQSAFLAQLAQESGELKYFQEIASGAAYEGRRDLGNTQPGDGMRFKGRGPIQLTGRANYRNVGAALGVDLERNPTRAADLDVAFRVAGQYWQSRNLNSFADSRNFDAITLRINGGYNGKSVRDMYYRRAKGVLGV
ncbi:MAG: LysM peptidoglycan-binding domain-containing protein [Acidobacteria bacterium]|nr:LysM peptidoglycan-binding domain-containing protein [Acidobacteriota bacterium]